VLYEECAQRIKKLLKRDEDNAKNKIRKIENKNTTERLRKLSNEVSKFIRDKTENIEDLDDDNYLEESDIPAGGMVIIPKGLKIPKSTSKKMYVYVNPTSKLSDEHITLSTESQSILVKNNSVKLIKREDGIYVAPVSITGVEIDSEIKLKVTWSGISKNVKISCVEKEEVHPFTDDFSFEKKKIQDSQRKV